MGRIASGLLFHAMAYDIAHPVDRAQDVLSLAAGHKAMGLYAMLALRNEVVRIARPDLLPDRPGLQVRLEDLLGFRRNPTQRTELITRFSSKFLDGHPTPAIPFVPLATGPSGVGVASSMGLALAMLDTYRDGPPVVHVIEGEGGATSGRVSEALAAASAGQIRNLVVHMDWNQSSIDSDACCRQGEVVGDYVQWDPVELAYLHDFNVILVPDGHDFGQILAAQTLAQSPPNDQPTCIVYRTIKGWRYGVEGRRSHGAGHGFCSSGFYESLRPFESASGVTFPRFEGEPTEQRVEEGYWAVLETMRRALESGEQMATVVAQRVEAAGRALSARVRRPHAGAPDLTLLYDDLRDCGPGTPEPLELEPGTRTTLRGQLGRSLGYMNRLTRGGLMGAAADLLDSTSVSALAEGMEGGFFSSVGNPDARLVSAGGICEDAMGGIMSGLSAFGTHIGVSASYAAFIAPLEHIAARCHAIGQEAKQALVPDPPNPWVIVMGHASLKTGEDGPTHADPQALQLFQENFPRGLCVTLTPWEPAEVWPLLAAALDARPAIVACYVTRPEEVVPDRASLRIAQAHEAVSGVYAARSADPEGPGYAGTVILQGSGVASEFFNHVLPVLDAECIRLNVLYVSSAELFARLEPEERRRTLPPERAHEAIGITDFSLPTLYRFVTSERGREASLHPFRGGRYLGSGRAARVLAEAGLDARSQLEAIRAYGRKD